MAEIGHNRRTIVTDQLQSLVDRIENLEEGKANIATDIKEVYAEGKAAGLDVKMMREIVKLRHMDTAKLGEREAVRDQYMNALGMLADTPLGQAALSKDG